MMISKPCVALIALVAAWVVSSCSQCVAQILTPEAVASASPDPAPAASTKPEKERFWSGLTMSKLTMPKISMPSWPKDEEGLPKSPFTPISAGMSKISAGTKKAWEGTKKMFSFGGKEDSQVQQASYDASSKELSFWDKLRGAEPEPDGPRTMAEWMSQPRINP